MIPTAGAEVDLVALPQVLSRDWTARAACRAHPTLPPETWDTEVEGQRSRTARRQRVNAARLACLGCPVAEPCLEEHLEGYGGGIRAGYEFPDAADFERPELRGTRSHDEEAAA